jgi:hypothetical protein
LDFAELFRVLARRWRVSVPVLLLTVLALAGAYRAWPTTYQSTAELSLIGSQSLAAQPGNGDNPYLPVGGLAPLASILAGNLSSDQTLQQLNSRGVTGTFTAVVPPFAAGPFVSLSLAAKNPSAVGESMPIVVRFAEQRLIQIQESGSLKTPPRGLIRAVVIAPSSSPSPVLKKKLEVLAGVAIIGLSSLFLVSFGAEARAVRRRSKLNNSSSHEKPASRTSRQGDRSHRDPSRPAAVRTR